MGKYLEKRGFMLCLCEDGKALRPARKDELDIASFARADERAKLEAEWAQHTAEAVDAARNGERKRVLAEVERDVRSALALSGVTSELAMRAIARLKERADG